MRRKGPLLATSVHPDDVSMLSVPRLPTAIEDKIADMMEQAAILRTQADELEKQVAVRPRAT